MDNLPTTVAGPADSAAWKALGPDPKEPRQP